MTVFDEDRNESDGLDDLDGLTRLSIITGTPDTSPEAYEQMSSAGDFEATTNLSETPCSLVTGCAGSGKSTLIRSRQQEDASYAVLTSSTGISAVNLNATTIHSLLGFFDTDSLRDAYFSGAAQRKLKRVIGDGFRNVVLDEISMISKDTLDLLVRVFDDVNQGLARGEEPIGLILSGDFCQLPPIPDQKGRSYTSGKRQPKLPIPWAFDASSWPRFARNITKLTKVWRQTDERYLAVLNYARSGNGQAAAGLLGAAGVQFNNAIDNEFDGTTLVSKNDEAERFNNLALDRVQGRLMSLPSWRWGQQRKEWDNHIPQKTILRENAYVMILSNKYFGGGGGGQPSQLYYVNGDCGHVRGIEPGAPGKAPKILVELVRNGEIVAVEDITRGIEFRERPAEMSGEITIPSGEDTGEYIPKPHYRGKARRYVSGQIKYFPIRLAFASTIHKAQGLSLDKLQIDFRSWGLSQPAMGYVSLSRCRTLEGLRIVGLKEAVAAKCVIDPRVREWL